MRGGAGQKYTAVSVSFDTWVTAFQAEPDFFWAPVNTIDDVLADPQTAAAGALIEVGELGGTIPEVASPVDLHGSPGTPPRRAPLLTEHTDQILAELALGSPPHGRALTSGFRLGLAWRSHSSEKSAFDLEE